MDPRLAPDDPAPNTACARCGRAFYCGAKADSCWCEELTLTPEARAAIAATGATECLCRSCLERFASSEP